MGKLMNFFKRTTKQDISPLFSKECVEAAQLTTKNIIERHNREINAFKELVDKIMQSEQETYTKQEVMSLINEANNLGYYRGFNEGIMDY